MIDECDFYMLLIGGRYGSIDEETGISYTEKEYNYAKIKGIPVLVLIRNSEFITAEKMDSGEDKYRKQKLLDQFKNKVLNDGNTVDFFSDINSLKYSASQTLKNAIHYANHDGGWVRYKNVINLVNKSIEEENSIKNKQHQAMLENMKVMLVEFGENLNDIGENQLTRQDISAITADEIDEMFHVENNTLYFGKTKSLDKESLFSEIKPTASVMLFFAAEGNGEIIVSSGPSGISFQAGNNPLNDDDSRDSRREEVKWEDAIDQLVNGRYINNVSNQRGNKLYLVTEKGYQLNDVFKENFGYDISLDPSKMLEDLQS